MLLKREFPVALPSINTWAFSEAYFVVTVWERILLTAARTN